MLTGNKPRALSEWAFFTSLAILFVLAGLYVPFLGLLATVVFPLPLILLVLRLDTRYAGLSLVVAGTCLFILLPGQTPSLLMLLPVGFLGILYGLLFKNQVSPGASILSGLAGATLLTLLSALLIDILAGIKLFALDQDSRLFVEQWLATNSGVGVFSDLPPELQGNLNQNVTSLYELFIPGQYIVASAAAAVLSYFAARIVLKRMQFELPPVPAFSRVLCPWYIVWGLIVGLSMTLVGDYLSIPLVGIIGKNMLFVLFYFHLVLGISVAMYFFRSVKLARAFKLALLALGLVYLPFSISIFLMLGVVDPLINMRKLPEAKE
ncbi:MAG: DUF2232 domain-containing protein [Desulfotomaculaceae bacterium]|nr:DUF2232 domain-containing protein [Desulfotomaculaceae bacterium]